MGNMKVSAFYMERKDVIKHTLRREKNFGHIADKVN